MSELIKTHHKWTNQGQMVNSGLCECTFHGEIIGSFCECKEFHSWCNNCWEKNA